MKGDPTILRLLNAQLTNELTAVNQYFLHARMYRHWGFEKLGKKEYEESIGEMKHADKLIDRILMLDGLPNLQALHKLLIGENTEEMLACDLSLERAAQLTVKEGILECEKVGDYVSRELFVMILEDTEEHIEWLETQLDLVAKIGIQNYLQSQM
jgi:bacterioferritin